LTDRPSCSDWAPSFGVDLDRVEEEDIAYWEAFRTTPKLVMNLSDARASFGSVFGDTTGLVTHSSYDAAGSMLEESVDIGYVGGRVVDARGIALGSDRGMKIFPMMFVTFGTTIIIAASLSLWGTLKGRSAKRAYEWGISRNMGLRRRDLFLSSIVDTLPSILLGIAISIPLGYAISYLLSGPLGSSWSGTGGRIGLSFVPSTALFSICASFVVSVLLVAAISAIEARRSVGSQVRGERELPPVERRGLIPALSAASAIIGIALILLCTLVEDGWTSSILFVFGASLASGGTAVLMLWSMTYVSDRSAGRLLVTANLRRRHVLTPVMVATLAITVGIAVAMSGIGSGLEGSVERTASEFGAGFDRYAELAAPNSEMLDRAIGSLEEEGYGVTALSSVGDEGGSCTNINAPFPPRLIGIPPDLDLGLSRWSDRFAGPDAILPALGSTLDGRVPILVDENTLVWIYSGGIGSVYAVTAEDGRPVDMVVVGILTPSVLSGSFVMADSSLKDAYPRAAKDSILLIKDPPSGGDVAQVGGILSGLAPEVRTVRDMARENMDYELGYLHLFRGFLVIGIVTGISSAVSFTAARTVDRSRDHVMLRSVGATRRTIGAALMAENGIVFGTASAGALVVGVLAGTSSVPVGEPDMLAIVRGSIMVPAIVVLFGILFSAVGSYLATREMVVRRRDE
jgi:hypothetical protein